MRKPLATIKEEDWKDPFDNPLYYDIERELLNFDKDKHIKYYFPFGERSAGKSFSACKLALKRYLFRGETSVFIRRSDEDWKESAQDYFPDLLNIIVEQLTNGKYNCVYYTRKRWYLARFDEEKGKIIKERKPFARHFSINGWEKAKGVQMGEECKYIFFDEVITTGRYLGQDYQECTWFLNMISTIFRDRGDGIIIMMANTIGYYCPYFSFFGIDNKELKSGDKRKYKIGKNLKILVHYTDPPVGGKDSDEYYEVEVKRSSISQQITEGGWLIDLKYPLLNPDPNANHDNKISILPKDIKFKFFLTLPDFDDILQGEIVAIGQSSFIYFHHTKYEIKEDDTHIIFSIEENIKPNYRKNIFKPYDEIGQIIFNYFKMDKVFIQDAFCSELLYTYVSNMI